MTLSLNDIVTHIRSREWWQDEHDQPVVPGRYLMLCDPRMIDLEGLRNEIKKPDAIILVHPWPGRKLTDALAFVPMPDTINSDWNEVISRSPQDRKTFPPDNLSSTTPPKRST